MWLQLKNVHNTNIFKHKHTHTHTHRNTHMHTVLRNMRWMYAWMHIQYTHTHTHTQMHMSQSFPHHCHSSSTCSTSAAELQRSLAVVRSTLSAFIHSEDFLQTHMIRRHDHHELLLAATDQIHRAVYKRRKGTWI